MPSEKFTGAVPAEFDRIGLISQESKHLPKHWYLVTYRVFCEMPLPKNLKYKAHPSKQ